MISDQCEPVFADCDIPGDHFVSRYQSPARLQKFTISRWMLWIEDPDLLGMLWRRGPLGAKKAGREKKTRDTWNVEHRTCVRTCRKGF